MTATDELVSSVRVLFEDLGHLGFVLLVVLIVCALVVLCVERDWPWNFFDDSDARRESAREQTLKTIVRPHADDSRRSRSW